MARTTFTHLYDTYDEAAQAVRSLEANGIPHADISIVSNDPAARPTDSIVDTDDVNADGTGTTTATAAGTGATLGTVLGGGAGLLAGLGALAIPGVGPVVAAGWLIASLTGAGAGAGVGGLLGSLVGSGVHHDDAHVYSEGVRRGGTVVAIQADEADAPRISQMLEAMEPVDIQTRRADYAKAGWSGYDAAAPGYTPTEVEAERSRVRGGNI